VYAQRVGVFYIEARSGYACGEAEARSGSRRWALGAISGLRQRTDNSAGNRDSRGAVRFRHDPGRFTVAAWPSTGALAVRMDHNAVQIESQEVARLLQDATTVTASTLMLHSPACVCCGLSRRRSECSQAMKISWRLANEKELTHIAKVDVGL
jgi:hypothetical protein